MKTTHLTTATQLKYPQFWLLAIGAGLIAIHLTLCWRSDNSNLLGMSFLFWAAISSQIWDKRHSFELESDILSSFLGLSLIGLVLLKSASLTSLGGFLYASPIIVAIGLALLASGFRGLRQYSGELLALFFLGVPKLLPLWMTDITPLTAKLSAFMLWYTGWNVVRSDVYIYLPTGSIEVASGCSGIEQIFQMLGLGLLFLLMFPRNWQQKILVLTVAGTLAFVVNGARVSLLAAIVGQGQKEAFDYWHHGDGSLIFSMISVLLFGLFCWFLLGQNELKKGVKSSSR
jgi:cyanoexosortase A